MFLLLFFMLSSCCQQNKNGINIFIVYLLSRAAERDGEKQFTRNKKNFYNLSEVIAVVSHTQQLLACLA
jgi:hypothetical protein